MKKDDKEWEEKILALVEENHRRAKERQRVRSAGSRPKSSPETQPETVRGEAAEYGESRRESYWWAAILFGVLVLLSCCDNARILNGWTVGVTASLTVAAVLAWRRI